MGTPRNGVILITGASSGIGRACADRLDRSGWTVVGASRSGTSSGGWAPLVMDVDRDDSVGTGFDAVVAEYGRLDAVVAGAGWGLAGPVEQTPIDDARAQLETNLWGAVRVVQRALPVMRESGGGRVVLISSIGGVVSLPFQAFYAASKFALEGFGEALAYEVAPFGIQVTLVQPGNVRTDFTARRRSVTPPAGDDPYGAAAARAIGVMAEDEANGVAPDRVAAAVQRVLRSGHPPRHVSVGKLDERVGIWARRALPYRLFERAAKGSLGVGSVPAPTAPAPHRATTGGAWPIPSGPWALPTNGSTIRSPTPLPPSGSATRRGPRRCVPWQPNGTEASSSGSAWANTPTATCSTGTPGCPEGWRR